MSFFYKWLIKKAWKDIFGVRLKDVVFKENQRLIDFFPEHVNKKYNVKISKGMWNDFIDGINRLPRPLFTFWAFFMLILPLINIEWFRAIILLYAEMPTGLLAIIITIISFWFAGKLAVNALVEPKVWKKKLEEADKLREELRRKVNTKK